MHRVVEPEALVIRGCELRVVGICLLRALGSRDDLERAGQGETFRSGSFGGHSGSISPTPRAYADQSANLFAPGRIAAGPPRDRAAGRQLQSWDPCPLPGTQKREFSWRVGNAGEVSSRYTMSLRYIGHGPQASGLAGLSLLRVFLPVLALLLVAPF